MSLLPAVDPLAASGTLEQEFSAVRIFSVSTSLMLLVASALVSAPKPAAAEIIYPWCAIYSERTVGATNCGFSTLAQCRATISGVGGWCVENPEYRPASPPRPKRHSQPR
jgi:hypothetical protein